MMTVQIRAIKLTEFRLVRKSRSWLIMDDRYLRLTVDD